MCESRKIFKAKLKFCRDNCCSLSIQKKKPSENQFGKFWKPTKKLDMKRSLPVSVSGLSEPADIADMFQRNFRVKTPLLSEKLVTGAGNDSEVKLRK